MRVCLYVFVYIYVNNSFPDNLEGGGKFFFILSPPENVTLPGQSFVFFKPKVKVKSCFLTERIK